MGIRNLTKKQRIGLEYFMIIIGTAIMAFASKIFLDPKGLIPGGFTGIAIILRHVTEGLIDGGIPLWLTNLILNIPLIPIVIKLKGWGFAERTLAASLLFSLWLAIIPYIPLIDGNDLFLSSVYGGVFMAAAVMAFGRQHS